MKNCFFKEVKDQMSDTSIERLDIISFEAIGGEYPNLTDDLRLSTSVNSGVVALSDESSPVTFVNSQGVTQGITPYIIPVTTPDSPIILRPSNEGKFYIEGKRNLDCLRIGVVDGHVQLSDESKNIDFLKDIEFDKLTISNQDSLYGSIDNLKVNWIWLSDNTNCQIGGDLYNLLTKNDAFRYIVIFDQCNIECSKTLTEVFDKIAETRHSGTLQINVNALNTVVSGEVSNLKRCTINFTSDTTTYPRGWYRTDF